MIPPAFDYAAPKTLKEAVALLGKNPEAKVLAGGHSLIPMMKFRLASPALLVDINRLDGLAYIREEAGWLKIGAMTRESDLDHSDLIHKNYPLLADTTKMIADPLVRNMATVGGNLAHADPANDHPATMLAYGAQVVATGSKGERVIPIDQFFKGPFETAQVTLGANGNCESVGIGLTNVGLTPIMAAKAEEALRGKKPDDANIRAAAQLAADAAQPSGDQRGSEEYKRSLVKTLAVRALRKAVERAKGG
jgi:carbon-monoxide dehydrogenase medium subunit